MIASAYTDIRVEVTDRVAVVTLDRPDTLNAVRARTLTELRRALKAIGDDPDIRCVVITGSGRAFCAGQDLGELEGDMAELGLNPTSAAVAERLEPYQALTRALLDLPKPTIAALNGIAVGMGAEIAVACDLRVASHGARIGFVEATRALFQTNGVMWLLPRIVGHGIALQMLLTGRMIGAEEACRLGLIGEVVDDALEGALGLASVMAANAPISLRWARDLMRQTWDLDLDAAMALEVEGMGACLRSADLREGTRAFLEGRNPDYRGV